MNNEFKKIKSSEETRYVLESASSGGTSSGGIASVSSALGGPRKRGDNLLAQEASKEKEAPKPRNFVAKNAKMGGAGKMKDKSKTIPRKEKHKKPVAEGFNGEYDDEAGMAHSNLLTSARAVMGLLKTIEDKDNLPEWVQEKIAKAEMMLVGVWDYLQSQKEQGIDPQVESFGRYGSRNPDTMSSGNYDRHQQDQMDYGKRAFKRAEMDHELGHERNNYAVAIDGRTWKVFADQRQAQNIARSLQAKGKNATVHETGANPTAEGVAEAPEDRTSYQVAKILSDRGIKYDPAQENELINAIGMVLVKELNMTPKQARYLISYDEDFVSDTLGELRSMEQSVSEVDVYMESLDQSLQQVLSEKAVSKKQQKFMGMVHAAQKGEKPASKEVAKAAKDMGKKDAKDFASTKHKGLPEKNKSKK